VVWLTEASQCFRIARFANFPPFLSCCSWVTMGQELNAQSACSMLLCKLSEHNVVFSFIFCYLFRVLYLKKCFRILHFYVCLIVLYKIICLQFSMSFICLFFYVFVSLPSVRLLWCSATLGVHAPESPTARISGVCDQGYGAETQISDIGSRDLKFLLPLQHLKLFSSGSWMIWSIENWQPLYYLYNLPGPQTGAVEREPKFEAPASAAPSKNFGLRLHHLRIWGSGSTALVVTRPDERGRSEHAAFAMFKRLW